MNRAADREHVNFVSLALDSSGTASQPVRHLAAFARFWYDFLVGDAGNDLIYGGADDDYIYGGTGDDNLFGDDGIDVLFVIVGRADGGEIGRAHV